MENSPVPIVNCSLTFVVNNLSMVEQKLRHPYRSMLTKCAAYKDNVMEALVWGPKWSCAGHKWRWLYFWKYMHRVTIRKPKFCVTAKEFFMFCFGIVCIYTLYNLQTSNSSIILMFVLSINSKQSCVTGNISWWDTNFVAMKSVCFNGNKFTEMCKYMYLHMNKYRSTLWIMRCFCWFYQGYRWSM